MKQLNITIHPFSALAGMALLGLVWVTAGAMPLQGSSSTRDVSAIENVNEPHPRDFVNITGAQPYVVPSGKILVLTAFGHQGVAADGSLYIDGVTEVSVDHYEWVNNQGAEKFLATSILQLPSPGLAAIAGQTVTAGSGAQFRAWGYLVDA